MKYQRIYLSSHIIYGSNRLGTKDYLPGQIYSMTDYTQAQPVKDTATLQSRRPWYSEEYQDNILYTHTEPWQATYNGIISAAERIGEKQYELSNHLGNVMATVSDNKYGVYGGTGNLSLESWRPAIRSAYDYYPFGMLMPGRYVSDTSRHCVTLTRPHWVWKWTVIGCKDYYAWVWPKLTLMGAATATPSENGILLNAQRPGEGMSFELNAQPNTENQFQLELNGLEMAKNAALQILEQNGEEGWTVLAEVPIKDGEGLTVPFYPSLGKVKVVLLGPIRVFIRRVCVEGMAWVEENQLVTICDGDGDRYRFGFGAQEKTNEIAGVGNHYTALFWEYDTRTAQRWNTDPVIKSWESPYATFSRSPIWKIDPNGDADYYTQKGKYIGNDGKSGDGRIIVVTNNKIANDLSKGKASIEMISPKDQFELPPFDHRQEIKTIMSAVPKKADYEVGGRGLLDENRNVMHVRSQDGGSGDAGGGRKNISINRVHSDDKHKLLLLSGDEDYLRYTWHSHPESTLDNLFIQEPSGWDIDGADAPDNFVISKEDKKVYYYNKDTKQEAVPNGTVEGQTKGSSGSFPTGKFYEVKEGER